MDLNVRRREDRLRTKSLGGGMATGNGWTRRGAVLRRVKLEENQNSMPTVEQSYARENGGTQGCCSVFSAEFLGRFCTLEFWEAFREEIGFLSSDGSSGSVSFHSSGAVISGQITVYVASAAEGRSVPGSDVNRYAAFGTGNSLSHAGGRAFAAVSSAGGIFPVPVRRLATVGHRTSSPPQRRRRKQGGARGHRRRISGGLYGCVNSWGVVAAGVPFSLDRLFAFVYLLLQASLEELVLRITHKRGGDGDNEANPGVKTQRKLSLVDSTSPKKDFIHSSKLSTSQGLHEDEQGYDSLSNPKEAPIIEVKMEAETEMARDHNSGQIKEVQKT
ncbi:membrane-anchored ubiquitin-fold protein 2 [Striga asiatica]|uniref:Membrane-anchored ubiquitin-fold protein 2 n=1 Tax=Striga asiatica TaxID=4170 RepID=A0A5A7NYK8_STRAF|nr:membrane-anchored ubiquitin-fold protein 2 [Striga asiatica]